MATDLEALLALAEGHEPPAKRPCIGSGTARKPPHGMEIEQLSGIRIPPHTRKLSHDEMRALSASFEFHRLEAVPRLLRGGSQLSTAWLTIGVLVDKGQAKPTQSGGSFCVWKLSDLKPGGNATTISVFLFADAFSAAWKIVAGTVVALLSAKRVPRKEGQDAADDAAVSIEKAQQLQRIGQVHRTRQPMRTTLIR